MGSIWPLLVGAAALSLIFRFLQSQFRKQEPSEALGDPTEDPFAYVPSPRRNGPRSRSGAVAVEEPDEDIVKSLPPRFR